MNEYRKAFRTADTQPVFKKQKSHLLQLVLTIIYITLMQDEGIIFLFSHLNDGD